MAFEKVALLQCYISAGSVVYTGCRLQFDRSREKQIDRYDKPARLLARSRRIAWSSG